MSLIMIFYFYYIQESKKKYSIYIYAVFNSTERVKK